MMPRIGNRTFAGRSALVALAAISVVAISLPVAAYPVSARSGSSVAAKAAARKALVPLLRKGTKFSTLRQGLLSAGWAPISHNPPCLNQVSGDLCAKLPEVSNTSSGPIEYNGLSYRHAKSGEILNVVAIGDIASWGRSDSDLIVDSWRFGKED